jgi:hypothetical protein
MTIHARLNLIGFSRKLSIKPRKQQTNALLFWQSPCGKHKTRRHERNLVFPSPFPRATGLSLSLSRPKHEKLHNAAHTSEGFFRKKTESRHPHYRASSWLVNSSVACSKLTVQALLLSLLLRLLTSLPRSLRLLGDTRRRGGEGRGPTVENEDRELSALRERIPRALPWWLTMRWNLPNGQRFWYVKCRVHHWVGHRICPLGRFSGI